MKKSLTKSQKKRRDKIFQIVEDQLRDNDPPETKETFDRLLSQGYSRMQCIDLIARVVGLEIYDTLKEKRPFNRSRFVERLKGLPVYEWD